MPEIIDKEEIRELIRTDPQAAIEILSKHPAMANRLHVNRKCWEYAWLCVNQIDPESRKEQRDAQAAENAIPLENLKRIREIEVMPAFLSRTNKDHKRLHAKWVSLHQQQ